MPEQTTNSPLRILIVEDEFVTLDMLSNSLSDMGYTVAGDAMTVEEARTVLASTPVDLAILDINVHGEGKGIALGHFIREKYGIPFIYLTAYSDPATIQAATETSPYGYLIKPFSPADIHAAIKVAMSRVDSNGGRDLYLRDQSTFVRVKAQDIYYAVASRNYMEVHTRVGKHVIRSTMKELIERLPAGQFLRPHRSYVVNAQHVRGYKNGVLRLEGNVELPVSDTGHRVVQEFFARR